MNRLQPEDWRADVIRKLLRTAGAEPDVRYPALYAALGAGFRIEEFPPEALAWIGDYLRPTPGQRLEISGRRDSVSHELVVEIMRAPQVFRPEECARLMQRIKSDVKLFGWALSHPDFPGFPDAKRLCLEGLSHSSATVANLALSVFLANWPGEVAAHVELLLAQVHSSSRKLRSQVAQVLGQVEGAEAMGAVRLLLRDPERTVRKAALGSLVRLQGSGAAEELSMALRDSAPLVRIEACQQIAGLGDSSLLPALLERATDSNAVVRRAAVAAAEQIDREAALRSFPAFAKGQEGLIEEQAPAAPAAAADSGVEASNPEDAVEDLEMSRDLDPLAPALLRCVLRAQAIAGSIQRGDSLDEAWKRHVYDDPESETAEAIAGLLRGLPGPDSMEALIRQLGGSSASDPKAEAVLIGLTGEGQIARWFSPALVRELRGLPDGSGGLERLIAVFGPDPATLYWPVSRWALHGYAEEEDDDEGWDSDDVSVAIQILPSLRNWALIRARPRDLGFLLACATPDWWRRIPLRAELPSASLRLLEEYGSLATSHEIVEAIEERWNRGVIGEGDAELELVAGMGDRGMERIAFHGQRPLRFPAQNLASR